MFAPLFVGAFAGGRRRLSSSTPPRRTVKPSARIPLTRAPAVRTQLVMEEVLVSEGLSVTRAMSGDAALELLRYSVFR